MGLDMYFYYRKHHEGVKDKNGFPKHGRFDEISSWTEERMIGYFRKANSIHSFIVNEFAEGKDECQNIYLEKKNFETMLEHINKVFDVLDGVKFTVLPDYEEYRKNYNKNIDKRIADGVDFSNKDKMPKLKDFVFDKTKINQYFNKNTPLWNYAFEISPKMKSTFEEEMPTQSGFFFGTTDYNGNYVYDLVRAYVTFNYFIKHYFKKGRPWDEVVYRASW